jgi:hypothetical protein
MEMSGQRHATGKGPSVPIVQEAGLGLRAGLDTEAREKIFLPLPEIEPRPSDRPKSVVRLVLCLFFVLYGCFLFFLFLVIVLYVCFIVFFFFFFLSSVCVFCTCILNTATG